MGCRNRRFRFDTRIVPAFGIVDKALNRAGTIIQVTAELTSGKLADPVMEELPSGKATLGTHVWHQIGDRESKGCGLRAAMRYPRQAPLLRAREIAGRFLGGLATVNPV